MRTAIIPNNFVLVIITERSLEAVLVFSRSVLKCKIFYGGTFLGGQINSLRSKRSAHASLPSVCPIRNTAAAHVWLILLSLLLMLTANASCQC